jgi:Grx4 family monothiol glutaredoxin
MTSQTTLDVHQIATQKEFDEYINSSSNVNKLLLAHVELEQVPVCKTVNEALLAISRDGEFNQQLTVCRLNADHFSDFAASQNVTAVPTVLFYYRAKVIDRVDGFNQGDLLKKIKLHINKIDTTSTTADQSKTDTDVNVINKIKQLLQSSPVILFMKGTPADPQCGFSRQACHILDEHKIKYNTFDVLSDQNIREQLKKYSNWNTYPQLYVDGELIGGLDIMKQMIENGEFELKLNEQKTHEKEKDMKKYLESLINQAPLMLFIKGTPETPRCGFTKELLNLLDKADIKDYKTFDILENETVRQKLKEYSSWQTYPQIYVNGQFIGGLDILKQMNEEGTLVQTLTGNQGVAV